MTDAQFERVRKLASNLAGIEVADRHRPVLVNRGRRLKLNTIESMEALLHSAEDGDAAACQRLITMLTNSHTAFFRHPWHFDLAAEHALWVVHRRRTARLWSAAAATGEEPYSLAMALIGVSRRDDPPATILATDINSRVLRNAQLGEYSDAALASLAPELQARFFCTPTGVGRWRISEPARRLVEFQRLNLVCDEWAVEGPFDIVFCRNMLMYLGSPHRNSIVRRIAGLIAPDGLLFLDPAENLGDAAHLFHPGRNGVYSPRTANGGKQSPRRQIMSKETGKS